MLTSSRLFCLITCLQAVAKGFARNGASVVIGDFNPAAQKTVDAIKAAGGKALFVRTDVSKWQDCEKLVADTVKEYGRLDFAFNNAGIGPNPMVPIADTTVEEYHRVIGVNQHGVFYCMKFQVSAPPRVVLLVSFLSSRSSRSS